MKNKRIVPISKLFSLLLLSPMGMFAQAPPTVVFPNGGQTLTVGSTVTITWSGTAFGTVVGIDYTINNWGNTTWLTTSYSNPSANSYTWVVPNTPGTQCKVGIFDTSFQGDISDNFFTIAAAPLQAPVAAFIQSGLHCAGTTLNFSDLSTNTPTSWSWSVSPVATLINPGVQNPAINFTNPGTYSVTLVSANATGSSAPVTNTLQINPLPVITTTSSAAVICPGQTATITATGAASYSWNTGAASTGIIVAPGVTMSYTVTGTASDNCQNKAVYTQSVNACIGMAHHSGIEPGIHLFLDPIQRQLHLHLSPDRDFIYLRANLYTILGEKVMGDWPLNQSNTLGLAHLPSGFYSLSILDNGAMLKTLRVIVP